jgi:hypothetical protein
MTGIEIREKIGEVNEDALFIDGIDGDKNAFNEALMGYGERIGMNSVAIYQANKVLDILSLKYNMDEIDALEWFSYNIAGAYVGENTPIFLHNCEE